MRRSFRIGDVALGMAVGAVGLLIALAIVSRHQAVPALTSEALAAAQSRWEQHGPANYRIDLEVAGRQASRYHVEVRGGKPTQVLRNDRPIPSRSWYYWTVPGLFEVLDHDMDCSEDPTRGFGARPGSRAVLRADFDPDLGYPRKFQRLIMGEPHLDMTWDVTAFDTDR
ncbi:MAG TPA: DUF6174 domain-containing protein [Pirellulales bacterium]|nr:DUF6174 domain-containing protein [Pirellulales bacterium]